MKQQKQNAIFLALAFIVVFFVVLVGVLLAEGFMLAAVFSFILAIAVMGYGFYLKRRWRAN